MIKIGDININYLDYGNETGKTIVLLHGWGQNINMMDMMGKPFMKKNRIINIDLPGFGESDEPKTIWSLEDYVNVLHELLEKLNIKKPILVGHSFGGRISIKYASKYQTDRVVLLSSPFRPSGKKSYGAKILKVLKKIPVLNKLEGWAKNKIGSVDYRNATPIMKGVLVKTVNEDLSEDAKKIKVPVLLICGEYDTAVPISESKILESIIPNAGLVIYDRCTHYAYLERIHQTIAVLKEFFK